MSSSNSIDALRYPCCHLAHGRVQELTGSAGSALRSWAGQGQAAGAYWLRIYEFSGAGD